MKCEALKEAQCTTDIGHFKEGFPNQDDSSGHRALRTYLDPKDNVGETLAKRAQYIQHILKIWEKKVNEIPGTKPKTYCYCKQPESGRMIQCDECMDWFHFTCAHLEDNFSSLDDWYCTNCTNSELTDPLCIFQAQLDPLRLTIKCNGMCKGDFHPECLGLDIEDMSITARLTWRCPEC
jgi:hypothetical protein